MTFTNRTVVTIAAAAMLLGGSAGAFLNSSVSRPQEEVAATPQPAASQPKEEATPAPAAPLGDYELADREVAREEAEAPAEATSPVRSQPVQRASVSAPQRRQSAPAARHTSSPASRPRTVTTQQPQEQRAYYDYSQDKPTWWQKHRDITTVGIGAGVGAAVGGIAGGKKGAAIGALAGGGGSALWTYKLRKRN